MTTLYWSSNFADAFVLTLSKASRIGTHIRSMEIIQEQKPDYVSLSPHGDLDANSSIHLDDAIRALIDQGKVYIHINFAEVPYISSPGLGVFISYLDEIKSKNGRLVLSNMRENVREVFSLLGLDQLVDILDDEQAVAQMLSHS